MSKKDKAKKWQLMLCPFHDDHSPLLAYNDTEFICLSCGRKGSIDELDIEVTSKPIIRVYLFKPLYHKSQYLLTEKTAHKILRKHGYLYDGNYHNRMESSLFHEWESRFRHAGSAGIPPKHFRELSDTELQRYTALDAESSSLHLRIFAAVIQDNGFDWTQDFEPNHQSDPLEGPELRANHGKKV
ncbi:MAG: hypothetical protein VB108_01340 [Anaerolineaceae bacterium]|nr:hypothetical protein [Anaerolineaceae bacterium]